MNDQSLIRLTSDILVCPICLPLCHICEETSDKRFKDALRVIIVVRLVDLDP